MTAGARTRLGPWKKLVLHVRREVLGLVVKKTENNALANQLEIFSFIFGGFVLDM